MLGYELCGYKAVKAQFLVAELGTTLSVGSRREGDYIPGGDTYVKEWKPDTLKDGTVRTRKIAEKHVVKVVVDDKQPDSSLVVSSFSVLLSTEEVHYTRYNPTSDYSPYGFYSAQIGDIEGLEEFLALDFQRRLAAGKIPDYGMFALGWFIDLSHSAINRSATT